MPSSKKAWPEGGISTCDVGSVSSGTNQIDVFIRGADGVLWYRAYNG